MVTFKCRGCSNILEVEDHLIGQRWRCPRCEREQVIRSPHRAPSRRPPTTSALLTALVLIIGVSVAVYQWLPVAGVIPLAFILCLVAVAAWAWVWGQAKHLKTLLDQLEKVPESQRQELVRLRLGVVLPKDVDFEQWIKERRQRYRFYAFLVLCFLILSLGGIVSLTVVHSNTQEVARLRKGIDAAESQLQAALDKEKQMLVRVAEASGEAKIISRYNPTTPEIRELADKLGSLVERFQARIGTGRLTVADDLRLRLAKALIANANNQYQNALNLVTKEDAKATFTAAQEAVDQAVRVNLLRGSAYIGLGNWAEALDCYKQILDIQPDNLTAALVSGCCLSSLGRYAEALEKFDGIISYLIPMVEHQEPKRDWLLASCLNNRSNILYEIGKDAEAIQGYAQAVKIYTRLAERERQSAIESELAMCLSDRGNTLRDLGLYAEAIQDIDRAVSILFRLVEREGRTDLGRDYSVSLHDRGRVLRDQGLYEEAIQSFDKAISALTRFAEREGGDKHNRLPGILSDRGDVLRKLGRFNESLRCFNNAIEIQTRLVEIDGHGELEDELAMNLSDRGGLFRELGRYAEAVRDHDKAVSILTRLVERERHPEFIHQLAVSLNNRGNLLNFINKFNESLNDYNNSIYIYGRIVEHEGRVEWANEFARGLTARCNLLARVGAYTKALADIDKAIAIRTQLVEHEGRTDIANEFAISLFLRGAIFLQQGKKDEATNDLKKALGLTKDQSLINNINLLLGGTGR